MVIVLPLPSKGLSPNARLSWRGKAKLTKAHRLRAKLAALALLAASPGPASVPTRYSLAFYWPDRRRRDDDNAAASCKAYRDGIADALAIDDSGLRMSGSPQMDHDPRNPRLEITLLP